MTITFYLHRKSTKNKRGYIYCKYTVGKKSINRSLHLPSVPKSAWNQKTQRLKAYPGIDHEQINAKIQAFHDKLIRKEPAQLSQENRQSFIHFFNQYLNGPELELRHGTRQKYRAVYQKLISYLKEHRKEDLKFEELDLRIITGLEAYLRANKISSETATHYLKIIRLVIRKAQKTDGYYEVYDPFINYNFTRKNKKRKVALTAQMIDQLRSTHIEDPTLEKARAKFLFQLFANGMRPSDLAMLRLGNLKGGRITYIMHKTKNEISLPINANHISQLQYFIDFKFKLEHWILKPNEQHSTRYKSLTQDYLRGEPLCRKVEVESYREFYAALEYRYLIEELASLATAMEQEEFSSDHGDYNELAEHSEIIRQLLDKIITEHSKSAIKRLNDLARAKPKQLVFDIIKQPNFPMNNLTTDDYNHYKKRNIVYNRQLKKVSEVCSLPLDLSASLARTSFASVLVNLPNINTQLISGALGHGSIQVTQHYIAGFDSTTQDEVTERFGRIFWK